MPEILPSVQISRELRPYLAELSFDRERFAASLDTIGVPEQSIGDLRVRFNTHKPPRHTVTSLVFGMYPPPNTLGQYRYTENVMDFYSLTIAASLGGRLNAQALSEEHNHTLAHESRHTLDYTVERAAVRTINEANDLSTKNDAVPTVLGGLAGGVVLGEIASEFAAQGRVKEGATFVGVLASLTAINRLKARRRYPIFTARNGIRSEFEERAQNFAASAEGLNLFGDIIQIEMKNE